ncbi:hypothetical protein ACX0G9_29790 [Flavitalea flava]
MATAVPLPGCILPPIAGGRLFFRPRFCIRGSAAPGKEERLDGGCASATTAMWSAVLHGGRPRGTRPPGSYPPDRPYRYAGAFAEAK